MTAQEYRKQAPLWADDAMRFAMRCCASRPDCEDAVQEALAALWSNLSRVPTEKGKGFLLSATYRSLMHTLRHAMVERRHSEWQQAGGEPAAQPDCGFDLREAIEHSLRSLPTVQRAILQLRDVEGYPYREIGEALDLSESQVQVYLFRARVAMRKQLKTMGYEND